MIFVSVGAQIPFDRLIQAVDAWAGERGRQDVFAQICAEAWKPQHVEWTEFLDPPEYRRRLDEATLIVAHAGMGSIISALERGKPILVMPRRGDLRETRNDHQVATARRFGELGRVAVANDAAELHERLDQQDQIRAGDGIGATAGEGIVQAIRNFVTGETAGPQ